MFWMIVVALVLLFACCLAMPTYRRERSLRMLGLATLQVVLLLLVPLATFVLSAVLAPESKGGAVHGWLDSFHYGKLALLPLVLWAVAALYALEVLAIERPWVALGLFMGALVSSGCLVFGIFAVPIRSELSSFLLIPAYTAAWYWALALGQKHGQRLSVGATLGAFAASLPFWAWGVILARRHYLALPETSDCFVVTAATRGHERLVGPCFAIDRNGDRRRANSQLVTFWRFESLWQERAPRTHRAGRRFYNVVGPWLAGRIRGPLAADLVFLLLKPAELLARRALSVVRKS